MTKTDIGLLVLTILLAAVSLPLLAGTIRAREARMQAVDSRLEKLPGLEEQLREAKAEVADLEQEILNVSLVWGKVWPNSGQSQVVDPRQGLIQYGIGQNELGVPNGGQAPVLYTFGLNPDGSGKYIGEFKITAAQPGASTGKLTRSPLPGETNDWPAQTYRVRTKVPNSYTTLIDELVTDFNIAAQDLQEEQVRVQRAQKQLDASRAVLAQRDAELAGDPEAAEDAADFVKEGLVTSIESATADRDKLLASVDRLRRIYRDKSKELNQLLQDIQRLGSRLPSGSEGMASGGVSLPSVR